MKYDLTALLRRSESETLDFKRDQYPFSSATEEQKSELLKDIVAMANAWKASDAYILIGIREKNQRADGLVGVNEVLADHQVQQFVNSKTNRPVSFRVSVVTHDGVDLSVIEIDKRQDRPIFLVKNFGGLKKEVVYIRRGSSTDEANPDEIAEMGRESVLTKAPDVSLEFEFLTETWYDRPVIPVGRKSEKREREFLKVYAVNHRGGLVKHLQGSVWIPLPMLFDLMVQRNRFYRVNSVEEFDGSELHKLTISNKISTGYTRGGVFASPLPPEWQPFSPGMRLCLETQSLTPGIKRLVEQSSGSIKWQLSINGEDLIEGKTLFSEIPWIDRRETNVEAPR